jgi:hypothetical protein
MVTAAEEAVDIMVPKPEGSLREKGIENLISCGFSPHGAVYAWDFPINTRNKAITGIMFALLSYFIFDGTFSGCLDYTLLLISTFRILFCTKFSLFSLRMSHSSSPS